VRVLERLAAQRALPTSIVMDNGPEFTGKTLDAWAPSSTFVPRFMPGTTSTNRMWSSTCRSAAPLPRVGRRSYNPTRVTAGARQNNQAMGSHTLCCVNPLQYPQRSKVGWPNDVVSIAPGNPRQITRTHSSAESGMSPDACMRRNESKPCMTSQAATIPLVAGSRQPVRAHGVLKPAMDLI